MGENHTSHGLKTKSRNRAGWRIEGRGMNRSCRKSSKRRTVLTVLVFVLVGLAASPAALADDRGGPGQPGAYADSSGFPSLDFSGVSWSD
jgi:hypothetical protein